MLISETLKNSEKKRSMNNSYTVFDCSIIHFNKVSNPAGNLTPVVNNVDIPFAVKRVYYLYDVPGGESRGAHAHKSIEQIIIAASGGFDITIDDGKNKKTISLNRSYMGFYLKPGMWRELHNFSSSAICLVLASEKYNPEDYIRNYEEFLDFKNVKKL
jgi:dTDP-4-dehydrorhamnose 3,5-epimerase-like enzyme